MLYNTGPPLLFTSMDY